jgi:hypothetical protein
MALGDVLGVTDFAAYKNEHILPDHRNKYQMLPVPWNWYLVHFSFLFDMFQVLR